MWASSIKLVFNLHHLSLYLLLCSYFHIPRRGSLLVSCISDSQTWLQVRTSKECYGFWCPDTPRPVKSETLEEEPRCQLFWKPPGDSIKHPSLSTTSPDPFCLTSAFRPVVILSPCYIFACFPPPLLYISYLSIFTGLPNGENISLYLLSALATMLAYFCLLSNVWKWLCTFSVHVITHFASNPVPKFYNVLKCVFEVICECNFLPPI